MVLSNGLEHEAERLSALLQAGCRAGSLRRERGLLVLEYVGEDLADLIRNDSTTRLWLARAAAADLAAFHARAVARRAQIRNITLREGELWRIDFEENIGSALSRPLTQAYDLFQMLARSRRCARCPMTAARSENWRWTSISSITPTPKSKCLRRLARSCASSLRRCARCWAGCRRATQGFARRGYLAAFTLAATNPADSQLNTCAFPHSIEAEQSVLGGLLLDNSAWDRIADVLIEEDFYRHDHRLIWHHIARLIGPPVRPT